MTKPRLKIRGFVFVMLIAFPEDESSELPHAPKQNMRIKPIKNPNFLSVNLMNGIVRFSCVFWINDNSEILISILTLNRLNKH